MTVTVTAFLEWSSALHLHVENRPDCEEVALETTIFTPDSGETPVKKSVDEFGMPFLEALGEVRRQQENACVAKRYPEGLHEPLPRAFYSSPLDSCLHETPLTKKRRRRSEETYFTTMTHSSRVSCVNEISDVARAPALDELKVKRPSQPRTPLPNLNTTLLQRYDFF